MAEGMAEQTEEGHTEEEIIEEETNILRQKEWHMKLAVLA